MTSWTSLSPRRFSDFVAARRGIGSTRILLFFGAEIGNAIGDTAIATRHVPCLNTVFRNCSIEVCTEEPDIWRALGGPHLAFHTPLNPPPLRDFDLVVFDSVADNLALYRLADQLPVAVLDLHRESNKTRYRAPDGVSTAIKLPWCLNNSTRIVEICDAISGVPVAAALPESPRTLPAGRSLFLNPYGSKPAKDIPLPLLDRLCRSLRDVLPEDITIRVSCLPRSRAEGHFYEPPQCGGVTLLPTMTTAEYIAAIGASCLVIAPDTSTQHIAAPLGTPSIALYPADSGARHYFWSPTEDSCIALKFPRLRDGATGKAFCALISCIAVRTCGGPVPVGIDASALRRVAHNFVDACRTLTKQRDDPQASKRLMTSTLLDVDQCLPRRWRPFIVEELQQFAAQLEGHVRRTGLDVVARQRLRSINAIKVINGMLEPLGSC